MAKAVDRGTIRYRLVDVREFAFDKHRTCDDSPYGGGAGMVLKAGPLARALDSVHAARVRTVFPTPGGRLFRQADARDLAKEGELVLICGRYEGVDQRVVDMYVDDEVSIGDYVISSGEVAALVIIDAVYRLISGVIAPESLEEESFEHGLLEYPHYTRPEVFRGSRVPGVLLSGDHRRIEAWRNRQSIQRTEWYRPDLADHRSDGPANEA
jgi:tRNA (guanine37-N1)-methyltransferase